MKTEKDFENLFFNSCQHEAQNTVLVSNLSKNYWIDLTSHLNGYFSPLDKIEITIEAAKKLSQNLISVNTNEAWILVIQDFNAHNYWNYPILTKKPKALKTEQQKISSKLFKYGWAFFQSMIILKVAVYYFGLESAENPKETSVVWVWFFFALSTGSLIFFAYRNWKDLD